MEEDYLKASRREAIFSWLLPILSFALFSNSFLFYLVNFNTLPLQDVILKLTHIAILFVSIFLYSIALRYRKECSQIIGFVNQLSWDILQMDNAREFRPMRNMVYLCIVLFRYCMCIGAFCGLAHYAIEPIFLGRLFFETFSPFGVIPLQVEAFFHILILCCQIVYCVNFFVIIFEPLLIYSISIRVLADQLRSFRVATVESEDKDRRRLKEIMRKCGEIRQ